METLNYCDNCSFTAETFVSYNPEVQIYSVASGGHLTHWRYWIWSIVSFTALMCCGIISCEVMYFFSCNYLHQQGYVFDTIGLFVC